MNWRRLQALLAAIGEREGETIPRVPAGPEALARDFSLAPPARGLGREMALARLEQVALATPMTSSHRFYNQLFAGREETGAAADMVGCWLNSSMYTFKVAGVQTLVETEVTRRMAQLAGFPDGEGTFVPGGSLGNLVGMVLARNVALPEMRDGGGQGVRGAFYLSAEGHYSVTKNAGLLGVGRNNVRRIPVDERGRMRVAELAERISADRAAGFQPLGIVATAGTTVLGAFDPIAEIGQVARQEGVWLHVDGALGATLLLHPSYRDLLRGVELADSLTWNPHKLMGMPLPCAAVLVRQRGLLHQHFNESADYLFQQDSADLNLGTKSIQCGRRNDALKLWASWQELGDDGWAARIERQMSLARYAADLVSASSELELVQRPDCVNVCFVVRGHSSAAICELLHQRGLATIGYGVVNGRKVIRLVTANPEVTHHELDRLMEDIRVVARELPVGTQEILAG